MAVVNPDVPIVPGTEHAVAAATVLAVVNAFLNFFPQVVAACAGLVAIVWYSVQLWESKTIRDWRFRVTEKRRLKKIARLEAAQKIVIAKLEALNVKRASQAAAAQIIQAGEVAAKQKIENAQHDAQVTLAKSNQQQ